MNQDNSWPFGNNVWNHKIWLRVCIVASIICIIAGFIAAYCGFHSPRKGDDYLADLGNWGSYLQGTTASLWSLAGVFLIVATFLAQQRQLADQDHQFKLQNDSIKRQNFESAFFQLLNLQNQIVSAMREWDSSKGPLIEHQLVSGRDCFKVWYESFKQGLWGCEMKEESNGKWTIESAPKSNIERYLGFYGGHQGQLGHYFRNLYHLFKFVDKSEIENKKQYTSLIRAQLSQYELALLFYNGLAIIPPEKENKFKRLIEEYGVLENFNRELLLDRADMKFYEPGAFE